MINHYCTIYVDLTLHITISLSFAKFVNLFKPYQFCQFGKGFQKFTIVFI